MPNTNLLTMDDIANRVNNELLALGVVDGEWAGEGDVQDALDRVVLLDADLLALLVTEPHWGNYNISLDFTDDHDLSPFAVLHGVIFEEMKSRFTADNSDYEDEATTEEGA